MSRDPAPPRARPSAEPGDPPPTGPLAARARHLEAIARIARAGLRCGSLCALLDEVVAAVADALRIDLSKILRLQRDRRTMLLVAGVGWGDRVVGNTVVEAGRHSQAGYTLVCGELVVVVEDLSAERRFRGPALLHEHGVVSGMSVVIPGDGNLPFGVLGVHSRTPRRFSADERQFLQSAASTLAMAIHRQQAEAHLRESRERLQFTLEAAEVGTWEWHLDTDDVRWSPNLERIHGRRPGDFAGTLESALDDVVAEDRPRVLATLGKAVRERTAFEPHYRIRRADGTVAWIEGKGRVVCDEDGRVRHLAGICMDVTARKRSEETQARLAAIVASTPDAIIGQALDGTVTTWNVGAERIYGYRAEEIIGRPLAGLFTDEAAAEQIMATITRGAAIESLETVHRRKDGESIAVWLAGAPIVDGHGTLMGASLIVRDITARKRTEQALRDGEQRFRLIAEHAVDLVYMTDLDGRFVYLNGAFERLLGYPTDRLLGRSLADLVGGDGLAGAGAEYTAREFRMRRRDGPPLWVEGSSHRIDAESGAYVVGIIRDIHARKLFETKLEHDANHDALTGLPNRTLFLDRLQHAMDRRVRQGEDYAVCVLDLDDFKQVNDRLGHMVGDQLLVQFAQRVNGCLRPNDTFARFGGDEFLLLLEDVGGIEGAVQVVRRILAVLSAPFVIEGHLVRSGASIGIALADAGYRRAEDALRDADTALYRVKDRGKGGMALFDPSMRKSA